jgi:hypothetical protein
VLALSDEGADLVEPYVEERGLSLRVGMGSRTNSFYGVKGIPHAVLIDPEGAVVWRGHPGGLSSGKVKEALKGARKPGDQDFLGFAADLGDEHAAALGSSKDLGKLVELARDAELGKLFAGLDAFVSDGDAGLEGARAALAARATAHAELLAQQAEAALQRLDVAVAVEVYEALAKQLAGREAGSAAAAKLKDIRGDARLMAELEAAEQLERTLKSAERLSTSKQRKKLEDFAEKHKGTRAGSRAAAQAAASKN